MIKLKLAKIAIVFLVLFVYASTAWGHAGAFEQMGVAKPKRVRQAPDFSLRDIHGKKVSLEQFKGKPVLLNFWATWCQACKEEMPSMQRLYDDLKAEGFEILAISIDRDNEERVREFTKKYDITFPVLLDQKQEVRRKYFIMGLPTSYLIDAEGKLRGFVSGAREWDHPATRKIIFSLANDKKNRTVANAKD